MTLVLRLIMNDGFSNRLLRVLPSFMGKSLVIAVKSSTKRNNKTRSCTWAKRIYIWRLLSSCRAPLNRSFCFKPTSSWKMSFPFSFVLFRWRRFWLRLAPKSTRAKSLTTRRRSTLPCTAGALFIYLSRCVSRCMYRYRSIYIWIYRYIYRCIRICICICRDVCGNI